VPRALFYPKQVRPFAESENGFDLGLMAFVFLASLAVRYDLSGRYKIAHSGQAGRCSWDNPYPHHVSPGARCASTTSRFNSIPRPGLSGNV
jgi:hypothetical protein